MSAPARLAVAPSAIAYEQAVRIHPGGGAPPAMPGPISVERGATALALAVVAGSVLLFWCARTLFASGGVRTTIRGIAWMGLVAAPIALAQHATAPRYFFWRYAAPAGNAQPFTPFVSRNDFAAWVIMALPVAAGYAIARLQSREREGPFDPETAFDKRSMLLGAAALAMTAGLLGSLSRSGLFGAAVGFIVFVSLSRRRMSARRTISLVTIAAAIIAVALVYVNASALRDRLGLAASEGVAGRFEIWRQTWPMVVDFWPVGSGVGTYERVMTLYQTSSRAFYYSHADNEYLQILAEGGALVAVPVAIAIVAGAIAIARRLRADRTRLYWIRAGAASGLLALAAQNTWEMTLRVPANAALFAVLAALTLREGNPARS
jgi:O-antigen ligase